MLLDRPVGVFSVPMLGGEERMVLEDALGPQALPDGSLVVVRINAARQWQPVKEALVFPEGLAVFGAMMIGRPRYRYHRLPERNAARIVWHGTTD